MSFRLLLVLVLLQLNRRDRPANSCSWCQIERLGTRHLAAPAGGDAGELRVGAHWRTRAAIHVLHRDVLGVLDG